MRMRKPVSRACDACRRRKIKCNGLQPCPACSTASIQCTFRHEHRKGGNQGVRAVVLNELRRSTHSGSEPSVSPLRERGPDFLTPDFINACIEAYFAHLYPVVPFLTREALEHEAQAEDTGAKVFIASFCAYVVTYGPASSRSLAAYESNTEGPTLGQYLLDQAISILPADRASSPSYRVVLTSFFLYGTYAGLGNYRQGWFYLREAATLFMICEKPTENDLYSPVIVRRLFWILLISERAHGIRRGRPVTLQITPATPLLDLLEDPKGLQYLADLLLPFDDTFFAIWTGSGQECSKDWLLGVEERLRTALPAVLQVSNEQAANLRVSQLWLQIKMWELFPRFGFLSSSSTHECLTFRYPIGVAKKMASLDIALPIESMQIHGVGLTEKIFDVACALSDVLPFLPDPTAPGPFDYLRQITVLMTKLPSGLARFIPVLLVKVQELAPALVPELRQVSQSGGLGPFLSPSAVSRHLYEEEVGDLHAHLRREYGEWGSGG